MTSVAYLLFSHQTAIGSRTGVLSLGLELIFCTYKYLLVGIVFEVLILFSFYESTLPSSPFFTAYLVAVYVHQISREKGST